MPSITIQAVPATPGRPAQIRIDSDLDAPAAVVLLHRALANLAQQNVPALDGEPALVEEVTAAQLYARGVRPPPGGTGAARPNLRNGEG